MARTSLLFMLELSLAAAGCETRSAEAAKPAAESAPGQAAATRKKAALTPALAERAAAQLRQHADAPIGSELRFQLQGKTYTARFEEHENTSGNPARPPGKHKGVTVYE